MKNLNVTRKLTKLMTTLALGLALAPAHALGGGVTDGGGNAGVAIPMSPDEIRWALVVAKAPVLDILQSIDVMYNLTQEQDKWQKTEPHKSLNEKLFKGTKTVYQTLAEAEFTPINQGGCEDLGGNENDASALKTAPKICFSLELLSKKLDSISGRIELYALIAHEVSHLVGTTEAEARALQEMIRKRVSIRTAEGVIELVNKVRAKVGDNRVGIKQVLAAAQKGNMTAACMTLMAVGTSTNALMQQNFDYFQDPGISALTPSEISLLAGSVTKALNALSFCSANQPEVQSKINQAFAGQKEMSLVEFVKRIYGYKAENLIRVPDATIRLVTEGNKRSFLAELKDVMNFLDGLEQSFAAKDKAIQQHN